MAKQTPTEYIHRLMPLCATLGVQAVTIDPDLVSLSAEWAPELCTAGGILHGGMIMALADSAAATCAFLNLPEGSGDGDHREQDQLPHRHQVGCRERVQPPPARRIEDHRRRDRGALRRGPAGGEGDPDPGRPRPARGFTDAPPRPAGKPARARRTEPPAAGDSAGIARPIASARTSRTGCEPRAPAARAGRSSRARGRCRRSRIGALARARVPLGHAIRHSSPQSYGHDPASPPRGASGAEWMYGSPSS